MSLIPRFLCILLLIDACNFIVYWAIGYALYQTDSRHSAFFLGSEQAMDEVDNSAKSVDFMQQYAFAITSVTIVRLVIFIFHTTDELTFLLVAAP